MASDHIQGQQNAVGKQTLANNDDAVAAPGKASLTQALPTTMEAFLALVKPGTMVDDKGGYTFKVVDNGFEITKAPGNKGLGHVITPSSNAPAWKLIAQKAISENPPKPAALAVTPATPAPAPVPHPNMTPPPPPEPGLLDRAMNVVNAEIQELHERANSLWNRATSWSPFGGGDNASVGPNAGPSVGPNVGPNVAPGGNASATPTATNTPAATTTPKPITPGKSLTPAGEINADTLGLGMTREGVGDTEYTLNGLPHADWIRLKDLRTMLAAHAKAVKNKPKTKDAAATLAPNELSAEDLAKYTTEKDELEEKAKGTARVLADQIASGKDDVTRFYCSGLSMWTLASAGYSLTANLKGPDGNDYKGLIMKDVPVDAKGKPCAKDKAVETKRVVSKTVYVTLRSIVDGDPQAIEVVTLSRAQNKSEVEITGTSGYQTANTDGLGGDLPLAATGAAGAFEAAGIGTKIDEMTQKPGDFAQSRRTTVDPITGKDLKHRGAGHAWQVAELRVEAGSALFGKAGSPVPEGGALAGWQENKKFIIKHDTDPRFVGAYTLKEAKRLEAQDETVVEDSKDTGGDGGVQISGWKTAPDAGLKRYTGYVLFYGRLGNSKWAGWNHATKESAEAAALAADAAAAAKAKNNDLDPIKQTTPRQEPTTPTETMPQEPLQESAPATPSTLGDVTTSGDERLA